MTRDTDTDRLDEIYIARQPLLDRDQTMVGFELQFHDTARARSAAPGVATANLVSKAFTELGLAAAFGNALTFIRVDADFLAADFAALLPPATVVLEIDLDGLRQEGVGDRCRALKADGYRFCLTDTDALGEGSWPLVEIVEWIKIDVSRVAPADLQAVTRTMSSTRRKLIAAGVNTQTQKDVCLLLGFDLLQGFYFAEPVIIEGRRLDPGIQGLLRLSKLLAEEADLVALDAAFRAEPALVINLLRLANSVGSGMRSRITSIRNAITAVGTKQLQRWLHMLIFAQGGKLDFARSPLLQLAALRGRLMELLAERLHPDIKRLREPAFLTGLMSVVPAALQMSMTDMLAHVALDQEVRVALSHRQGVLGNLLAIVDSYDANDTAEIRNRLLPYGEKASLAMMGSLLAESVAWVQQLGTEAG